MRSRRISALLHVPQPSQGVLPEPPGSGSWRGNFPAVHDRGIPPFAKSAKDEAPGPRSRGTLLFNSGALQGDIIYKDRGFLFQEVLCCASHPCPFFRFEDGWSPSVVF